MYALEDGENFLLELDGFPTFWYVALAFKILIWFHFFMKPSHTWPCLMQLRLPWGCPKMSRAFET